MLYTVFLSDTLCELATLKDPTAAALEILEGAHRGECERCAEWFHDPNRNVRRCPFGYALDSLAMSWSRLYLRV